MTPEERKMLEKVVLLSTENNEILKGIKRNHRLGVFFRILYWLLIIGISYGAYVYIQPYVDQMMGTYKTVIDQLDKFGIPS